MINDSTAHVQAEHASSAIDDGYLGQVAWKTTGLTSCSELDGGMAAQPVISALPESMPRNQGLGGTTPVGTRSVSNKMLDAAEAKPNCTDNRPDGDLKLTI